MISIDTHPKTCSFFGHRKIEITEDIKQKVKEIILDLIINHSVSNFLFGSRSDFDHLCYIIVSEIKEKFSNIKRIAYTCKSESCILENEKQKCEKFYSYIEKRKVCLLGFDEEFEHKTKYTSGKASYVERNYAMIDNSHFCIFYYDENYAPPKRKKSKRDLFEYQPKSGTKLAYEYAKRKNKTIFNIYTK